MEIGNSSEYIAFNSYGGFDKTGKQYHILNTKTPLPWCNIMANENFGTIISTYGTVYSYFKNSQGYKISNWCNDWITFKPGEVFKGIFEDDYNLVYGFGYTKVLEEKDGIQKSMEIFVPSDENIKVQYITLKNTTSKERSIAIEYYIDPVLGVTNETTIDHILTKTEDNILYLKNPYSIEFPNYVSFLIGVGYDEGIFVNVVKNYGVVADITLKPNEQKRFAIILGAMDSSDKDYAKEIKNKYLVTLTGA